MHIQLMLHLIYAESIRNADSSPQLKNISYSTGDNLFSLLSSVTKLYRKNTRFI